MALWFAAERFCTAIKSNVSAKIGNNNSIMLDNIQDARYIRFIPAGCDIISRLFVRVHISVHIIRWRYENAQT